MEKRRIEVSLPVQNPKTWTAEHPNLYLLSGQLNEDHKLVDHLFLNTGFRQTEIRGSQILVNGKPVKLRGTCHHDSHPMKGRAVDSLLTHGTLS